MLHLDEGQKLLERTLDLLVMSHRDRLGFGIRSARTDRHLRFGSGN